MIAREAIIKFCQYQERSHYEVRSKLFELQVDQEETESLIADLISLDYLNEERFARAIVRGKFRMKGWGRKKIRHWLSIRHISEYCLEKGLEEIDEEEYVQVLDKQAKKKWESLSREKEKSKKINRCYQYLIHKGFEPQLVLKSVYHISKGTD